ncbi:response regulator [Fretibacter rubidus]|uniref:hybrid sensor histidine kinase/response regulator n=1 Tax=Fretibacter rubidus TaxID=570162 RepID=UPI00352B6E10
MNTAKHGKSDTDIALAQIFSSLFEVFNPTTRDTESIKQGIDYLKLLPESEDWFINNKINLLLAYLYGYQDNLPLALSYATESLNVIPNQKGMEEASARIGAYDAIAYFHCYLRNPELAIPAIQSALELRRQGGEVVNGIHEINNLIYAFSGGIDNKTALDLIEILLRIEKTHQPLSLGITELRASQIYIDQHSYAKALEFTNAGLAIATHGTIIRNLQLSHVQALAGLGDSESAKLALLLVMQQIADGERRSLFLQRELTRANALIAAAEGDTAAAMSLMQRYNDLSVQRILQSNNSDTASLLANLENDKTRQRERAEMQALKQAALENRIKLGLALLIIMVGMLIFALAYVFFMRYRAKTAEQLAIAAEAALSGEKAKSQFLALVSHELRTPLNGIIGIADLLSKTAPTEDLRHKIGIVNKSGHDLLQLVEQVLDMSRIDANEMEIFPEYTSINTMVESLDALWRPTIEAKGVAFTTHLDGSVPSRIKVDPLRLRQCINNLISNAAKFTSEGRVHMHITADPIDGRDAIKLKVVVADTGIGMTDTVMGNLFKPFVQADSSITRQYGGSGLGLAITRSLARMMDGDVSVVSRKDAGTEFTLSLEMLAIYDAEILNSVDAVFQDIDGAQTDVTQNTQIHVAATAHAPNAAQALDFAADRDGSTAPSEPAPYDAQIDAEMDDILGVFPEGLVAAKYSDVNATSHTAPGLDHSAGPLSRNADYDLIMDTSPAPAQDQHDATHDIAIQPPARNAQVAVSREPAQRASQVQTLDEANIDSLQGLRVLIVEDVPSNHDVMKIFLEPQGCLVMGAENGAVAVDAANTQEFDVILMDIRMPEMNGIEATKAIRERGGLNAHVPIIALTADATAENNAQCMAAGADIFLTKPIIATELYDAIRFVRRQALRRALRTGRQSSPNVRIEDDRRRA